MSRSWSARSRAPSPALLGVFALPSLLTRRVVIVLLGLGGLGALRHASFSGADTVRSCCWAGATLVALLLADRADAEEVTPLANGAPLAAPHRRGHASLVAIAVIVAVAVVALAPTLSAHLGRHVWPGTRSLGRRRRTRPSSLRPPTSST